MINKSILFIFYLLFVLCACDSSQNENYSLIINKEQSSPFDASIAETGGVSAGGVSADLLPIMPPPPCPPGTDHCPCYPNNTCARINGVSLVCEQGICLPPPNASPPSSASALGQACNEDDECGLYGELTLSCEAGRCALLGCPTGASGCPCGAEGRCDEGLLCSEVGGHAGVCFQTGCVPGEALCPCSAGGGCIEGARCEVGVCRFAQVFALSMTSQEARGCQVRVTFPEGVHPQVRFDQSLRGQSVRRGQALGVSFVSREDRSARGARVLFSLNDSPLEGRAPSLEDQRCVDRLGRALSAPALSLARVSAPSMGSSSLPPPSTSTSP